MTSSNNQNFVQVPALTGLRGVAAVWVMLLHLWQLAGIPQVAVGPLNFTPLIEYGYLGVDIFFVLSGYLLGGSFVQARLTGNPMPSLRVFWLKRFRRIMPPYIAQIAILTTVAWAAGSAFQLSFLEWISHALLLFNLYGSSSPLNPVYWSLPIEWDFYLFLPIFALIFGCNRRWLAILPMIFLAAVAFRFLCWFCISYIENGIVVARWIIQFPSRFDQFFIGMFLAFLSFHGVREGIVKLSGIAGVVAIILFSYVFSKTGDVVSNGITPWVFFYYTLTAIPIAAIIFTCIRLPRARLVKILGSRPFLFAGTISYSLYLWHYPIFAQLRLYLSPHSPLLFWTLAPLAAILVSLLSWRLFEYPFTRKSFSHPGVLEGRALEKIAIAGGRNT